MATIKDVAKLANVSISTVSKYFNEPERMTDSYRKKVSVAVEQLNFKPNSSARLLRAKHSNTIALIVPDITNNFYTEVYNAIRLSAFSHGYNVTLHTFEEQFHDHNALIEVLDQLASSRIDGFIMAFLDEDEVISPLNKMQENIPLTLISWDMENSFSSVVLNLSKAIYSSTNYMISKGYKKIAYVGGTPGSRISREKYSGFLRATSEHNIQCPSEYYYEGLYTYSSGYKAAKRFMSLSDPPSCIVCANDVLAIGCCKYLNTNNFSIPEDIAIIGLDGIKLGKIYDPSITTFAIPIESMCKSATDLLMHKIEHPHSKNKKIIFEAQLNIGKSTDKDAPIYMDI